MYFIDRNKIEETLRYFNKLINEAVNHSYETFAEKLYLERTVHMSIESILDVGNMMIDGFIMRDPGSYEDIIDILVDESVLPENEAGNYKSFIGLRKIVVKDYLEVDHQVLEDVFRKSSVILSTFSNHIREYLNTELGVANAFSKE